MILPGYVNTIAPECAMSSFLALFLKRRAIATKELAVGFGADVLAVDSTIIDIGYLAEDLTILDIALANGNQPLPMEPGDLCRG
jgi:hypothetical protein